MRTSLLVSLTVVLGLGRVGHANVPDPDVTAPLSSWTPVQQWMPGSQLGYTKNNGAAVLADELGDHLSELGRANLIVECLGSWRESVDAALTWAVCGPDVAALDMKKLEAELTAEQVDPAGFAEITGKVNRAVENANKVGAFVEKAAKDDPGIAAILKLGETSRTEWAAYASKNREAIDRYFMLRDAVRSRKNNDKGFDGCFEPTKAAFAKVVAESKVPLDVNNDPLPGYFAVFMTTTEGYIASVSWAACAVAQLDGGLSLYAAAANQDGGMIRIGPRTLTIAKAYEASFKPKFADRSVNFSNIKQPWKYGVNVPGINPTLAIMTPGGGTVSVVKTEGAVTKIGFKGNIGMECAEWRSTGKVNGVNLDGSTINEKTCASRTAVHNEVASVELPTKYAGGITKGVSMTTVNQFPVVVWTAKKIVAVLGIPVKH